MKLQAQALVTRAWWCLGLTILSVCLQQTSSETNLGDAKASFLDRDTSAVSRLRRSRRKTSPDSFLQVNAEALTAAYLPLFNVAVNYSRTASAVQGGWVSMVMDSTVQGLRVQQGRLVQTDVSSPVAGVAYAQKHDNLASQGWIQLRVELDDLPRASNDIKMYGAGFLEGLLTAERISQFYSNFYQVLAKDQGLLLGFGNVRSMFYDELAYLKKQCNFKKGPTGAEPRDNYWKQMRYQLSQLFGIRDGYNYVAHQIGVKQLDVVDLMIINSHSQLPILIDAYSPAAAISRRAFQERKKKGPAAAAALLQRRVTDRNLTFIKDVEEKHTVGNRLEHNTTLEAVDKDWERRLARDGHCSAMVKVMPSNMDLLVGHTTWNDYSKMTRIFKYYGFKLPGSGANSGVQGFSSYPGCIASTDDFYMLDSGLAVVDTSLEVLTPSIYDRLPDLPANPRVPDFMHVMAVNRLAQTGLQWTNLFATLNTGTNIAQFIVVDYNRFLPGQSIKDNTVRMLEQIPGMTHQADLSNELNYKGYWASFNRPYFQDIRKATGHTAAEAAYGALYSFDDGPRAKIFRNNQASVANIGDMMRLMNRNMFPKEVLTGLPLEPGHAISARLDLTSFGPIPNGGIDSKVTGNCLLRKLQCKAISGPTHENQPVFMWRDPSGKELFPGWPHMGLPNAWNFNWVNEEPESELSRLLPLRLAPALGTCLG